MANVIQRFGDDIAAKWCRVMHPDPMWPVNGTYQCRQCLRKFPVPWEQKLESKPAKAARYEQAPLLKRMEETAERVHA